MKHRLTYVIPLVLLLSLMAFATCHTAAPAGPAASSVTIMYTTDMLGELVPCG